MARDLGMTHAEMMRRVSVAEFTEWVALYRTEAREAEKAQAKASKPKGPKGH